MGLAVAGAVGFLSGEVSRRETRRTEPAGFAAGLLHGAAMPCALPALLVGRDLILYAANNTGRGYKIGYTTGVNLCGAAFFGLLYRRFAGRRGDSRRGGGGGGFSGGRGGGGGCASS